MSLENNIKRIADALEIIANNIATAHEASDLGLTAAVEKTTEAAPTKRATPAVAPAPKPAPVTDVAPLAPVLLTDEEMNNALVAEFKRFGNREVIDAEMAKLGVTSVVGMTAENQNALLTAVRAFDA